MEALSYAKQSGQIQRQLATLKIVSRLLSHELHAQQNSKSVTLSRDEVLELQTCIDLFIEDTARKQSTPPMPSADTAVVVGARNN